MASSGKVVARRNPYFFKIFFPQLSGEKLGIPPNFWRHIDDRTTRKVVSLKGPSGNIWIAELVRDASGISIQNGWPDFVKDNSIMLNDFLLFRYDGYSEFTIFIFGKTACEKEEAFFATSCQEVAIVGDSSTKQKTLVNLTDDLYHTPPHECFQDFPGLHVHLTSEVAHNFLDNYSNKNKHQNGLNTNDDVLVPIAENNEALVILDVSEPDTFDGNKLAECNSKKRKWDGAGFSAKKQHNKGECQLHATNGIQTVSVVKEEPIEFIEEPIEFIEEPIRMKTASTSDEKTSTLSKKKKKTTRPSDEKISSVSDKKITWASKKPSASESSLKKPITYGQKIRKESHIYAVRPKGRWDKLSKESRQVLVKARMGTLVSNRRSVSEEEIRKAREAAQSFRPRNPSTLVIMRESYVYHGFYLSLPTSFARVYLPDSTQRIKIWDPNGNVWTVNYVVYLGRGGISAKWGAFSVANNLEKDDVCVFELIHKNELKVHIFRVVDEITPLTRVSSRCEPESPLLVLEGPRKKNTEIKG